MQHRWMNLFLRLAALLVVGGCASTGGAPNVWRDPGYAGPPFTKLFVIGLSSSDLTDRRAFEDLMVGKLRDAGSQAVPGWQYLPAGGQVDQATMLAAFRQSGADAVLLSRTMGFATQSRVVTGVVPGPGYGIGAGGGYTGDVGPAAVWGAYSDWYAVPYDQQYQVATIHTTLFDGRTMNPVWTYDPQTYDPSNLRAQAVGYANQVVGLLQSGGLLAVR
jgi:hypothetical protein